MTNEELSAKVAEVRGERLEDSVIRNTGHKDYGKTLKRFRWHTEDGNPSSILYEPMPYATDMNAAWELVEDLMNDKQTVTLEKYGRTGNNECRIGGKGASWIEASTMPRAICKAYLDWRKQCN